MAAPPRRQTTLVIAAVFFNPFFRIIIPPFRETDGSVCLRIQEKMVWSGVCPSVCFILVGFDSSLEMGFHRRAG
jgi:hypothetical protein